MKYILLFLLFPFLGFAENSFLVSYSLDTVYAKEDLKTKWKENRISEFITPVKFSVEVYEIIYKTRWHDGSEILASGYYYVPVDKSYYLPTAIMNHGTKLKKEFKVSLSGLQVGCVGLATDGYATLFPHYIGLGKGEKSHLYQINDSEAFANIDMLRAVRELNIAIGLHTNGQLFVTGYSQGGHAAMATHQMIQEEYSNEFQVTASAPMSGAYDMSGVQAEVMYAPYKNQAYLPYLLLSINEKYGIVDGDPYIIFKEPYQTLLRDKMDGTYKLKEVSKLLPEIPADMINDSIRHIFETDPNYAFSAALEENNNYNWKPETPVLMCYCKADEQVTYKNAFIARDAMKANGAKHVKLRSGGKKFDHNQCALFSLMYAKFYFDSFRKGREHGGKGPLMKRLLLSIGKLAVKKKK